MSDAGRVAPSAARLPAPAHTHIGPVIPAGATVFRYAAAVGVILSIFALRALLAPLLGLQAPLLPFLLGVLICAYLGGRGPAVLASVMTPLLATVWFTNWPHDAPPLQWLAHVTFFLLLALLATQILHALQVAVRRADQCAAHAEAAAEALRENDRRKDEFLAMLAHELRNPLSPIRNVAYILGRLPADRATVQKAAEMLARQAGHLTHLVDDLLDVARITHRRIELKRDVVDLQAVVAAAMETVQPTIDLRRQSMTLTVGQARACVHGDQVRLCQVVANLLTNASKYSAEGQRIQVDIAADTDHATISVRDQGQGIDAQTMPRLFDLFMQGDRTLDRAQGGLGIGLTLVKHLMEMHGGKVDVVSEGIGKGSEFRLTLPRVWGEPSARAATEGPRVGRQRRVLVVDDHADNLESLRDVLRTEGHDVITAADGPSALASLDDFTPEVILLDVGLPRMDGYMVAHAIRARYGAKPRPRIIALTGYAGAEDRLSALRSGFDDHLPKPVEPEQLLRVVAGENLAQLLPETPG